MYSISIDIVIYIYYMLKQLELFLNKFSPLFKLSNPLILLDENLKENNFSDIVSEEVLGLRPRTISEPTL